MKKVIIILLFLLTAGGGVGSTLYFRNQVKVQQEQNAQLVAQSAQVQQKLNAIGSMTTVYQVGTRVYSGKQILETDLVPVSVPASTLFESSITDKNELIGKFYKVDINPGTILSKDMLMKEDDEGLTKKKFTRTINFTSLPVGLVEGDYIDLRMMLPNGEEFVVFNHAFVKKIFETTILLDISEEENVIIHSMLQDEANYKGYVLFYLMKYLEPGNDTDTIAFYPIQHEMENFVRFNPNIDDVTRCINTSLRDHIDEVLLTYTAGENASIAKSFISGLSSQYSAQLAMHQDLIDKNTDEEGNVVIENNPSNGSYSNESNFQAEVGEAVESIDQNLEELEAIQ